MNDYFKAHRARMQSVSDTLRDLAVKLKERGCDLYASSNPIILFMLIEKDGKHVWLSFEEVPYSWSLRVSIKPSRENGSGYTIKTIHGTELPFTIDQIIESIIGEYNAKKDHFYLVKL